MLMLAVLMVSRISGTARGRINLHVLLSFAASPSATSSSTPILIKNCLASQLKNAAANLKSTYLLFYIASNGA